MKLLNSIVEKPRAAWLTLGPVARWRAVLAFIVVLYVLYLAIATKPWTVDLDSKHRVLNYWAVYSWVAVAMGVLTALLLGLISPWWAGRTVQSQDSMTKTPRWFWPLVLAAMVLPAFFAIPRLNDGLWDDEEYNIRKSIVGSYKLREADEPVKFQRLDWSSTALEYREPNNHILNSLLARAMHDAWRSVARPGGLPFTEWPLRVPSYIAGVLSIAGLAWMLLVFGMPKAGILAAYLAALHPWYLRYTSECRGYAFALLLVPVILGLWHRAVFRGSWKCWALLGIAQLAMVYAYPGTLFVLVVLNAATIPVLFFQRGAATPFRITSGRWFCSNALTAMVAIPLLLPLLPQMSKYLDFQSAQAFAVGKTWIWNEIHYFVCGTPWWRGSSPAVSYPEIINNFGAFLWFYWAFLALVFIGLVLGVFRFVRFGPLGWGLIATIIIPPFLTFGFFQIKTQIIYESYIIYALPGMIALFAAGIMWPISKIAGGKVRGSVQWSLIALVAVVFAVVTQPTRAWLIKNPLQQIPESVIACRGTLDPSDSSNNHILTGSFCIPPYLYDPKMIRLDSAREFVELMKKADSENRPLYINIGMPWAARDYSPGMWSLLNHPNLFDPPVFFRGWDSGLDRMVVKYKPGSASPFDFSEALESFR